MLDRIGVEVARATSIVRYAPGSEFSRHEHARGEEFYVLEGIFADEHGHYPAGTYVRNPPGSGHSPFSKNGCRIFVKLRQFDPADLSPVVIDTNKAACWLSDGAGPVARMSLHEFGTEVVQMLRLQKGADFSQVVGEGGFEILIVSGSIDYTNKRLGAGSWLRLPAGSNMRLRAVGNTTLWIKSGHLPNE
jgi:quercetin dioxygenase-like cupin family protein